MKFGRRWRRRQYAIYRKIALAYVHLGTGAWRILRAVKIKCPTREQQQASALGFVIRDCWFLICIYGSRGTSCTSSEFWWKNSVTSHCLTCLKAHQWFRASCSIRRVHQDVPDSSSELFGVIKANRLGFLSFRSTFCQISTKLNYKNN